MTNAQINKAFLESTTPQMAAVILENIAKHYGITASEAKEEILDAEAENVLDYITGSERAAVSVIYRRFKYQFGIA